MATGDVTDNKRVRLESGERLDLVDADAISRTSRDQIESASRALLATPLATAAAPVGLILTGGSVTVNPTSGSDGKLRVNSELFVALDANGRPIVKPTAVTITVAIPAGGAPYQVYLYTEELATDPAKRRRIPVVTPFTEFTFTPDTTFTDNCNIFVRSGAIGSVVPSDVVDGITTPLVLLGIATNTAGVVAFTPSDNRLSTVKKPSSTPSSSSENGSMRTFNDATNTALYEAGRAKFSSQGGLSGWAASIGAGASAVLMRVSGLVGMNAALVGSYLSVSGTTDPNNAGVYLIKGYISSTTVDVFNESSSFTDASNGSISWSVLAHLLPGSSLTPRASSNYGAYADPRHGVDEVDRSTPGYVTIGDGTVSFGTFDASEFASGDLCLQAALDAVVAQGGGTVVVKPGVVLGSFSGDVTLADGTLTVVDITLEGSGFEGTTINFGGHKIIGGPSTALKLRNIYLQGTGTVISTQGDLEARDCYFASTPSNAALIAFSGTSTVTSARFFNCRFLSLPVSNDNTIVAFVNIATNALSGAVVLFHACRFEINSYARRGVHVDLGSSSHLKVSDCSFNFVANVTDLGSGNYPALFRLDDVSGSRGAQFVNCSFRGSAADANDSNAIGVEVNESSGVTFGDCVFDHCRYGLNFRRTSGSSQSTRHRISNCRFVNDSATNSTPNFGIAFTSVAAADCSVVGCFFSQNGCEVFAQLGSGYDVENMIVSDSTFINSRLQILGDTVGSFLVRGNSFQNTTGDYILPPYIAANTTTGKVCGSYVGNSHRGYASLADASLALGVWFQGFGAEVIVSDNLFREVQFGIAYTGSTTAVPNPVILFQAKSHRWIVSGNHFQRLGITSTGANLQEITCVHATSSSGGAVSGCTIENCLVIGNRFGGSGEPCAALRVGSGTTTVVLGVRNLRIAGNVLTAPGPALAGTQAAGYGWKMSLDSTAGANGTIDVQGNTWTVEGGSTVDWFVLSGAATVRSFLFNENTIFMGSAFASNKGLHSDATHTLVTFVNHVSVVDGVRTEPNFYTDILNLGSSAINPSDPGVGGGWANNFGVQNVVG